MLSDVDPNLERVPKLLPRHGLFGNQRLFKIVTFCYIIKFVSNYSTEELRRERPKPPTTDQ